MFRMMMSCFLLSPKLPEDSHVKPPPQRHKQYGPPNRPPTPRTPKHRLSVDANLKIPEVLNSASKKDILRRVGATIHRKEVIYIFNIYIYKCNILNI